MHKQEIQWCQTEILSDMDSLIIIYDKNMHQTFPELNSLLSKLLRNGKLYRLVQL